MRFAFFLCLLAVLISCDKVKKPKTEIVYKIPDPLRDGIKRNKISEAKIQTFNIDSFGKLILENHHFGVLEYDSLGNISYENVGVWLNEHRFLYDENGFKRLMWYNGCNTYKEASFYNETNPFELSEKVYDLKDYKWNAAVDTNRGKAYSTFRTYVFNINGNLIKIKYESRTNTTYCYDSLNRLVTIIDSLDRKGEDYDLPVRKEFIYNNAGKLSQVNELNRSNLLTRAKVNNKGLIDTIYYFNKQRKIEKLEVYEYKY